MKAKEVQLGDVVGLHVYGEVVGVKENGKHATLKLVLENQGTGHRCVSTGHKELLGVQADGEPGSRNSLEWTDEGCTVEFIVKCGRQVSVYRDDDDDDDDGDEFEPIDPVEPKPELID